MNTQKLETVKFEKIKLYFTVSTRAKELILLLPINCPWELSGQSNFNDRTSMNGHSNEQLHDANLINIIEFVVSFRST